MSVPLAGGPRVIVAVPEIALPVWVNANVKVATLPLTGGSVNVNE